MRVLLVEDDPMIGSAVQAALKDASYAADWVKDGSAALTALAAQHYDLVLLDLGLPGRDGLDVLRTLRSRESALPVLVVTARDAVDDRVAGLDAGADDYVTKPFAVDELLARVRALLRRPQQQQSNILKAKSIKLDTINRTASLRNKPLELTVKEFALLEYLMRSAGRVVSKEQIIAHVWNFDADILPNTVEVYIKYLRNKIDKAGGPSIIKTVRGVGDTIEG